MKIIFTLLVITFQLHSQELSNKYFHENIKLENLKANLEFLASDELEGREATFRGEKIAALLLAAELQKYGVKPFYKNSYLQEFPVEEVTIDSSYTLELWDNDNLKIKFKYLKDFLPSHYYSANIDTSVRIFFAGYGVTAPEYNYDSYKNIDVKGNVVLVLNGMPDQISHEDAGKYSFYPYKVDNAINHGALAMISIEDERILKNWDRIVKQVKRPGYSLLKEKNQHSNNNVFIELGLNPNALTFLLNNTENESHEIPGSLRIKIKKTSKIKNSFNVIGVLEGIDPELKNDYVTICSHFDHIGIVDGKIHNGADDNASGTVAVLEIARLLTELGQNKRSILFAFHGGEEKGYCLGSEYFTEDSLLMKNIVSLINLDMIGRKSEDSIYSVGSKLHNPEFRKIIEETNDRTSNLIIDYSLDDPQHPERLQTRGDHFHYSKNGIPFVFFNDYMLEDYHMETDDIKKINYNKIVKIVELSSNLALKLANLKHSLK